MRHLLTAKGLLCLLAAGLGTLLAAERCGSGAPAAKAAGPALQPAAKYAPTPEELRLSYARAERLKARLAGRMFRDKVTPHWFDNNTKFWYRNDNRDGAKEFILVDAQKGTRGPAFDHDKLAAALSKAGAGKHQGDRLPFSTVEFVDSARAVRFQAGKTAWQCDLTTYECVRSKAPPRTEPVSEAPAADDEPPVPAGDSYLAEEDAPQKKKKKGFRKGPPSAVREARSPDGKWLAFVRESNVWLRDKDGKETQLTRNGVEGDAFSGLTWSPDSQAIVAYRTQPGEKKVVYRIETSPRDQLPARLLTTPYARPGDKFDAHEMWLIDVAARKPVKVELERIDFRGIPRLRWKKDARHFLFERTDRGHQRFRLIEVDARTGKTRNVIEEKAPPQSFIDHYSFHHVQYLPDTDEVLFTSEMDGWKHLYLIDARAGKVKNQITKGHWVVRGIDRVDVKGRQIWFRASGKNPDQDPYLIHYYRVNFDGTGLVALTEGNGSHTINYSPDGKYLIDSYSRQDLPPVTELRRTEDGKRVCLLEKADVSALEEAGWRAPEVFVAKGRDGKSDIWGVVCRPQNFDPKKSYPIIEYIYAGPHGSHVPKTFSAYRDELALAELGFIVVRIDGMGTANRSRAFHDVCWKNLADAGFPDRILWIKALAKRYPYMDTERVGIYGTSAGGQNSLGALLFFGHFYKAAVSSCGCHDNRLDKYTWNEQWMGLLGPHYEAQSNVTNAHKLTGKLLLILGELDTNVPPESTMRVVDALIRAGKEFDLLVVPGMGHSGGGRYGETRRRDFFVRHLHGVEPPNRNAPRAATN